MPRYKLRDIFYEAGATWKYKKSPVIKEMNLFFKFLCLIHILIWLFILLAFIDIRTANINLFYVIPAIYIIHFLPFHVIILLKKIQYPNDWKKYAESFEDNMLPVYYFKKLSDTLAKHCTLNPISPQGMMIFGAITSACRVKPFLRLPTK